MGYFTVIVWVVAFHEDYLKEFDAEADAVQDAIIAASQMLERFGPLLHRPYVDTLKGSSLPNMKELRITLPDGEWRVAFAFDPGRQAILLCGGSKYSGSQMRFYDRLIRVADSRYTNHLMIRQRKSKKEGH